MLRLLHFPLDPFSRKVRVLLREKELEAGLEPVEPWRQREQVAALNPAAGCPCCSIMTGRSSTAADLRISGGPGRSGGCSAWIRSIGPRCGAWWRGSIKFLREVTDLIWREKVLKFVTDREPPNSGAVRVGVANLHAHLAYIGYLFEQRSWLAGEHISLADIAAGACRCSTISATCPGRTMRGPSCGTPG